MSRTIIKVAKRALFYILILIIIVYLLFPLYWALNSSLKSEAQLQMMPATFIPRDSVTGEISFSLINYKAILYNKIFLMGIINSCIVAFSTTFIALLAGSFAGFAIGMLRFRGKQASMYIILAMSLFPQITILTGLFMVINLLKLDARASMSLSCLIFILPFTTWVLALFLKSCQLLY